MNYSLLVYCTWFWFASCFSCVEEYVCAWKAVGTCVVFFLLLVDIRMSSSTWKSLCTVLYNMSYCITLNTKWDASKFHLFLLFDMDHIFQMRSHVTGQMRIRKTLISVMEYHEMTVEEYLLSGIEYSVRYKIIEDIIKGLIHLHEHNYVFFISFNI